MRPRRACGFTCVVLAGTMRDLWVQEFLRELIVSFATPSDLARSIIAEILHSGEGGDVEQVAQNLPCLRLLIFSALTCVYISCMLLLFTFSHA